MTNTTHGKLIAKIAKATGIKEADVAKVLDHLGLKEALKAAEKDIGKLDSAKVEAKIALKLGKRLTVI